MISFMLEDQELFLSDKIVTIINSFVTEQSFCIARMVLKKEDYNGCFRSKGINKEIW